MFVTVWNGEYKSIILKETHDEMAVDLECMWPFECLCFLVHLHWFWFFFWRRWNVWSQRRIDCYIGDMRYLLHWRYILQTRSPWTSSTPFKVSDLYPLTRFIFNILPCSFKGLFELFKADSDVFMVGLCLRSTSCRVLWYENLWCSNANWNSK